MRELGFEDGVDTLAENGTTAAERLRARMNATEIIIKISEHRASLPGNAYPLAPYKEILKVLDRLWPNDNPFLHFGPPAETKREQLAADLFDRLARLIIALLLMKLPPGEESTHVDAGAIDALSETERHVLTALQQWGELFTSTAKHTERTPKNKKGGSTAKVNLDEVAVSLIDGIMATLDKLRSELQEGNRQPMHQ